MPPGVVVIKTSPEEEVLRVPSRKRAFLGVQLLELTDELRHHFGVEGSVGVLVARVEEDSPASEAGVEVGDILVAVDAESVVRTRDVVRLIRDKEQGEKVAVQVVRQGKKRNLTAELTIRHTPQLDVSGLLQFLPDEGTWQFEVEGEQIVVPMPRVEELRERVLELHEREEQLRELELEQKLELRLRELEEKLEQMEEKLRSELPKTSHARDT
jgi:membrane-associated protease RseP (regulator of RpoE activity)